MLGGNLFFPGVGSVTNDVAKLVEKMTTAEKAARQMLVAMAEVLKIYYAFYVSDINGSIAYTEAFDSRYGGTFTPKWESQQTLFNAWEAKLKTLAATLKTGAANQVSLTNYDQYYAGNSARWAKAANALRMRIAMRMLKRDAAKATTILKECVADASNLMSSNDDSWNYIAHQSFTAGGNWNPQGFRAPEPTVNFMWTTSDPRIGDPETSVDFKAMVHSIHAGGFRETPFVVAGATLALDAQNGRTTELRLVLPATYSGEMPGSYPWD